LLQLLYKFQKIFYGIKKTTIFAVAFAEVAQLVEHNLAPRD
jgi:hypothetical protein